PLPLLARFQNRLELEVHAFLIRILQPLQSLESRIRRRRRAQPLLLQAAPEQQRRDLVARISIQHLAKPVGGSGEVALLEKRVAKVEAKIRIAGVLIQGLPECIDGLRQILAALRGSQVIPHGADGYFGGDHLKRLLCRFEIACLITRNSQQETRLAIVILAGSYMLQPLCGFAVIFPLEVDFSQLERGRGEVWVLSSRLRKILFFLLGRRGQQSPNIVLQRIQRNGHTQRSKLRFGWSLRRRDSGEGPPRQMCLECCQILYCTAFFEHRALAKPTPV